MRRGEFTHENSFRHFAVAKCHLPREGGKKRNENAMRFRSFLLYVGSMPEPMATVRAARGVRGLPSGDHRAGQAADGKIAVVPPAVAARGRRVGFFRGHNGIILPNVQDTFGGCVGHISRGCTPQPSDPCGTERERGTSSRYRCRTGTRLRAKPVRYRCKLRKRRCRLHQLR